MRNNMRLTPDCAGKKPKYGQANTRERRNGEK